VPQKDYSAGHILRAIVVKGEILEKVRLGKTGMMVSKLGFGGIPIQRVSRDDAIAVVSKCLDLGITFIDTANAYNTSEECIGEAISGRREGLVIATKTLARKRDEVEGHLRLSLQRLGVNSIDLYQFHNVSDSDALGMILNPDGPIAVIEEAKRLGIVKHVGVSCHSLDVAKQLVKSGHFETIMFPLNLITHEAADELLPLAREHDVGFVAMKPLEGGLLTNVSLAFKYLLQFPDVVTIVGIEKLEEIIEIVDILKGPLAITEAEQMEIARLRRQLGKRFCRRCNYCQPCTQEIPISIVMEYPSIFRRLPAKRIFSEFVADAMEKAATCTKCGECEERCPYDLPIREMLEDYVGQYQAAKIKYRQEIPDRTAVRG
jgi:predicted aldo/keto reductase-like oxidoreductase